VFGRRISGAGIEPAHRLLFLNRDIPLPMRKRVYYQVTLTRNEKTCQVKPGLEFPEFYHEVSFKTLEYLQEPPMKISLDTKKQRSYTPTH
jgi:hypothetical protein